MSASDLTQFPSLNQLQTELTENLTGQTNYSYIGETWLQLAFDAIHDEVCNSGSFPHSGPQACSPKRDPQSFNQEQWDEGTIFEIAMRLIKSRFIDEGQANVILASSSDRHAYNLARKQAGQILYQIQTREREAGRVLRRVETIYSARDQFFKGHAPTDDYFSHDGSPPAQSEIDVHNELFKIVIRWPIKQWQWGQPENQSPYGNAALRQGASDLLESLKSYRKWALYDALEETLAHHKSVSLYVGRGLIGDDSREGQGYEVRDVIEINHGLPEQTLDIARQVASEIFESWSTDEINLWSKRLQVLGRNSVIELTNESLSRQTFTNRLRKIVEATMQNVSLAVESSSLMEDFDTTDFTSLVWEILDDLVVGEFVQ